MEIGGYCINWYWEKIGRKRQREKCRERKEEVEIVLGEDR